MIHLKNFNSYNDYMINEGWLADKVQLLSVAAKTSLTKFVDKLKDLSKDIKDSWGDDADPKEIQNTVADVVTSAFTSVIKTVDKLEKEEELIELIVNITEAIVHFKDAALPEVKSDKNKIVIKALLDEVIEACYEGKDKYAQAIKKEKDLKSKKVRTVSLLKEAMQFIDKKVKSLNTEEILKEYAETNKITEYKPGDKIKYTKKDNSENIGIVSDDQSEVHDEENFIQIKSEDGAKEFQIPKNKIVGIANDDEPEELKKTIAASLDKLTDPVKIKKISDILNEK